MPAVRFDRHTDRAKRPSDRRGTKYAKSDILIRLVLHCVSMTSSQFVWLSEGPMPAVSFSLLCVMRCEGMRVHAVMREGVSMYADMCDALTMCESHMYSHACVVCTRMCVCVFLKACQCTRQAVISLIA